MNAHLQTENMPLVQARPVLSAVVFAYRSEATILRAVSSLVQQDFEEPFEVLVATSGGDGTGDLVRQNHPAVRVVESPVRLMPGGARNLGAENARGEIIAFLEADCVARPGWMRNTVAAHRAGHEAVSSAVAVANPRHPVARAAAFLCHDNRLERSPRGPAGPSGSYGLSFTHELLRRLGPFDEARRAEEVALMAGRIRNLGVSIWFEPSVCIEQWGPATLRELVHEQASRGRRQARSDLLNRAPGSIRLKLASRSGLSPLAVALGTARHALVRGRSLARTARHSARARHDLIKTSPWVLLGFLANTAGWVREQRAYTRTGTFTDLDGGGPTRASLRRQNATTGEKTLALTFDDGPSEFTADMLGVLSRYGVPATFFVLGQNAAEMPDAVRSIADRGHGLGIHGWSHTAFTELAPDVLTKDLSRTEELLRALTGTACRDIRPPMGFYDGEVISRLTDRGFVTWLWTAEGRDWSADAGADQIARRTLLSLTPGGIILLHDGRTNGSNTARALPKIIEGALARGFRFVLLGEAPELSQRV